MGICDFSSQAIKHHMLVFKKKKRFPREYLAPRDSIWYPCLTGKEAESCGLQDQVYYII